MTRPRCAAFSLTELIVAIGVVTVLITLCLGGMQKIMSSASGSKCLANLRQLGVGASSYFQDRNGVLFPDKFFYTASFETDGGMRDYVGYGFNERTSRAPDSAYADSVFTCPDLKKQTRQKFSPPGLFNRTYSLNEFALAADAGTEKPDSYPKRLSRIPSLSGMMLFMDGSASGSVSSAFHTVMNPSYVSRNFFYYPHNEGQNVLFFDGHVARVSEEEIRKPTNPRKFWGNLDLPES